MRLRSVLVGVAVTLATVALPAAAVASPSLPSASDAHLSYVGSSDPVAAQYGAGNYVCGTIRFCGSALDGNTVLSVADLESLALDASEGLGYENTYSLMTSGAAFSKTRFTGVKLADLLVRLGLDADAAGSTAVRVYAVDGYTVSFTLAQIRESSRYACYASKTGATVQEASVPVLLSFAADGVPLVGPTGDQPVTTVFTAEEGYDETIDNCGGPIRFTIGQTLNDDYNARYNIKWVTKIVVGDDTDPVHEGDTAALAASTLSVDVHDASDGELLSSSTFTADAIESLSSSLRTRNYYDDGDAGGFYEGVDLWSFLSGKLDLPGYEGTATFETASGDTATVDLDYLRNLGSDHARYAVSRQVTPPGRSSTAVTVGGLHPVLAFAKNGAPMVVATRDAGYVATGVTGATVDNDGGPLAIALPSDGTQLTEALFLSHVTRIDLEISVPDDLHTGDVYGGLAAREVTFGGEGLSTSATMTVGDLEQRVDSMVTHDYEAGGGAGASGTYHGIHLLQFLKSGSLGLAVDAGTVTVNGSSGSVSFTVDQLEDADAPVLLAFSRSGVPLVQSASSDGYEASAGNSGGPLMLVSGSYTVADVTSVSVSLEAGLWTHAAAPYDAYLNRALSISGDEATTTILSLAELEAMDYVRDSFAASKGMAAYQGVVLRDLVMAHLAGGVDAPSRIRVYGADGYAVELDPNDVLNGLTSSYQPGETRDVLLAYAKNGCPLVSSSTSEGYVADAYNGDGPVHLVVENTISAWVKDARAIVVGEGEPVYASDRVAARSVRISSPTASQTRVWLARGTRLSLRAVLRPAASTDDVSWSSSRSRCATVSRRGVVRARSRGVTRIKVRTSSGRTDTITVVVTRRTKSKALRLPSKRVLKVGQATRLVASLAPRTATCRLTWRSGNRQVASVDRSGRVVALRRGRTKVVVRTSDGRRAVCTIVVRKL